MTASKHRHISEQANAIAAEVSKLAIACDIDVFDRSAAERILSNDESVCGRSNPEAFQKMRQHLMAFFPLKQRMIDRVGADDVQDILDQVRTTIAALRGAGSSSPASDDY